MDVNKKEVEKSQTGLVWDLPVRLFHWLLVIALIAQWYTGDQGGEWLTWHFYIGYFILGLVLFRVLWGLMGTRYARFSQFLTSPLSVINYLRGTHPPSTGHNPGGGYMVVFLLLIILLQAVSGLFTSDEIFTDGPWRSVISSELQDLADWAHGNLFTVIQIAAALHIAAAFYYLVFKKQNLIGAMFHGKKTVTEQQSIQSSKLLSALLILLLVTAAVASIVYFAPEVAMDDYF